MGNENCGTCEMPEGKENIRASILEHTKVESEVKSVPNPTKQYDSKQSHAVLFPSGISYEGEWLGKLKHGFGVQSWPDGARYEGEWVDGKANGKGKFIHSDGDAYEGEWKDDKANGYGVYTHSNGAKY